MPFKNKPRRGPKRPRTKVAFDSNGKPNQKVRKPFHDYNPEHHDLYDLKVWRSNLIPLTLQKHPDCQVCLQMRKVVPTEEIDHIVPHKGDYYSFIDETNLWGLCKRCHGIKTGMESNGIILASAEAWAKRIISYIRRL